MSILKITINNIKSIQHFSCELPLNSGIYALVGLNGSGKSTILAALSLILRKQYPPPFPHCDTSEIEIDFEGKKNILKQKDNVWWNLDDRTFIFEGMYEGSLFYGTRFIDSKRIDYLVNNGEITGDNLVPAHDYVKEKMSSILHGEPHHYDELYKIPNRRFADKLNINNIPYFYKYNDVYISQYKMSSGECLLISLLHYIYNALINKSVPDDKTVLILIDEVELALHPAAVSRLCSLFADLLNKHPNLVVYFTTHSPEVIKELHPQNIFLIERNYLSPKTEINLTTPCYPNYAIRSLHEPCGYDNIILVEDCLAKRIVETVLWKKNLCISRLIKVIPAGGWENVLQLQESLVGAMVFGKHTRVCSILDGDIKDEASKKFKNCCKRFLPIPSLEKFIFDNLFIKPNFSFKKLINDKYFTIERIDSVISQFNATCAQHNNSANKQFYKMIINNLPKDLPEEVFVSRICEDILGYINIEAFAHEIKDAIDC